MDILVLGGAGQVGTELQALSWPAGTAVLPYRGVHGQKRRLAIEAREIGRRGIKILLLWNVKVDLTFQRRL